jgi:murein L,D-transpeptidase YcbB/YkuD
MAENEHDDSDLDNEGLEISDDDAEALLADDTDNRGNKVGGRRKPAQDDSDEDDEDDDAPLGKAGQRALEALKEQRKAARTARDQAKQEAEDLRRKLAKYESANKSELQRLIDERDALKDQLSSVSSVAKRRDAAEELAPDWATAKQVRFVAKYVTGSTDEELEAAAEELYAQLAPKEPAKPRTPARPKERLRPGQADPEEDDLETDPRKLADAIRRNR